MYSYVFLSWTLRALDRNEEAIALVERAIQLNPTTPNWYLGTLGSLYCRVGRYEDAITAYKQALDIAPNSLFLHIGLAATYSLSGKEKEARTETDKIMRLNPKFSLENYSKTLHSKNETYRQKMINALSQAGLK